MSKGLRLRWGARSIGEYIHRSERQTSYLLGTNRIRAAKKVGEQWCANEHGLDEQFAPGGSHAPTQEDNV